jgi:hypothetical protein
MDEGMTKELPFSNLIGPQSPNPAQVPSTVTSFAGLPTFFAQGSKVTLDHEGSHHKGFVVHSPKTSYYFGVKSILCSTKVDFTVPLLDFHQHWPTLVGNNIIIPGHTTVSSFLCPNSSNNAPSLNFVSAKNLLNPCPPSLQKALHLSNPNCDV